MLYYDHIGDLLKAPHILIAGQTGSGKSVLLNDILYHALFNNGAQTQLILIDPKRVELARYRTTQNCIYYGSEPDTMVNGLRYAMDIIEQRFKEMQKRNLLHFDGSHIYIVIDELADLMTTQKKTVLPLLQRIGQIGRAANVHLIACTQCPLAKIIPTELKVNFETIIGLHVRTMQDSRNIIGLPGCELLPKYGKMIVLNSNGLTRYNVPYITEELNYAIWYRSQPTKPAKISLWYKVKELIF